jgi:hypothetical protein
MVANSSRRKPMWAEVAQCISIAWSKVTWETIINTRIVLATRQATKTTKIVTEAVWWKSSTNQMKVRKTKSQGGDFLLGEAEPLFCGSNTNEVDDEEPLFFLEPTAEQRAAANLFHVSFTNGVTEV